MQKERKKYLLRNDLTIIHRKKTKSWKFSDIYNHKSHILSRSTSSLVEFRAQTTYISPEHSHNLQLGLRRYFRHHTNMPRSFPLHPWLWNQRTLSISFDQSFYTTSEIFWMIPLSPSPILNLVSLNGQFPLIRLLPNPSKHFNSLALHQVYFLSQIVSENGLYLIFSPGTIWNLY